MGLKTWVRNRLVFPPPEPECSPASVATQEASDASWIYTYRGHSDDELAILHRNARACPPSPDHLTDFIGGLTHERALWGAVKHLKGTVSGAPIPADHHAEAIEWIGLLKCVESCRDRFIAMELGAGWGPWIVSGGVAARNAGISDIRLTGVEADPGRFELMRSHLADNDFDPDLHSLLQAAVGPEPGNATWPRIPDPVEAGGARPNREGNEADRAYIDPSDTIEVEILSFADLLAAEPQWDLVHIDIQGWETEVCASAKESLNGRVRWLIVGTHSRVLDGSMMDLMWSMGWHLENEKPSMFRFDPNAGSIETMTTLDGAQVWRNPAL